MQAPSRLLVCLEALDRALARPLTEDEVERLFNQIYHALGYTSEGLDIRGKRAGESGVPDVVLLNSDGSFAAVIELKKPSEELTSHEPQIRDYLRELRPAWGLLSNGTEFWFYRRGRALPIAEATTLDSLREDPTPLLNLRKQTFDLEDLDVIEARFRDYAEHALQPITLNDVASRFFLEAFSLSEGTVFTELVSALFELFISLEDTSRFLNGSFSFWRIFHARRLSLDDAPESWLRLLTHRSEGNLYRLMFVLETAYVVTARLILAKAVQDKDVGRHLLRYPLHEAVFAQLRARTDPRTGRVPIIEYAPGIIDLFASYSRTLFSGIFSEDIFDWWQDFHLGEVAVGHRFSRALAQLAFSILRFDFTNLDSDFLGELYQRYFDPETRKDLGEFYTPVDLVDFILDCVGYHGSGRLLDPACGSGTFLIRALRRYLNANEGRPPEHVLAGITDEFQLIGFDINPFAVLMSEINVAALLVPLYAEAVSRDRHVVLRRLPIIQTDSLRREYREGEAMHAGIQLGMDFGEEEIRVRILICQCKREPSLFKSN